ncbi:transposase [Candidatus Acetothermia bacterium]|nr:transposase [Candidatus Acetothermia bacterium]
MKKKRQVLRLQGYDYSQIGAYFVTICTQNKESLFGEIVNDEMVLNHAGGMVQTVWDEIPQNYPGVEIDMFRVMPNHVHGIIILVGAGPFACPEIGQPQGVAPTMLSLPDVIHRFKTLTTKRYTDGVKRDNWPPFPAKLWQRNYYEHIIRNEDKLHAIREYMINNPLQWELDRENPNFAGGQEEASKR